MSHRARFQSGELEGSCCRELSCRCSFQIGELDGSCCRELFHRASFHSVDMVTQRLEVTFNWLKSYLGETQENIETCSLRSCIRTISISYRVSFLTGDPLNSLNTRSRVNWLINSLSVRYCKDICT